MFSSGPGFLAGARPPARQGRICVIPTHVGSPARRSAISRHIVHNMMITRSSSAMLHTGASAVRKLDKIRLENSIQQAQQPQQVEQRDCRCISRRACANQAALEACELVICSQTLEMQLVRAKQPDSFCMQSLMPAACPKFGCTGKGYQGLLTTGILNIAKLHQSSISRRTCPSERLSNGL